MKALKRSVSSHPLWVLTTEQKSLAVDLYNSGQSSAAIARQIGTHKDGSQIRRLLNRRGVVMRDSSASQRKKALNEDAFSTLTPDAAYWLGFLMADGSVCEREVRIAVAAIDIAHLEF